MAEQESQKILEVAAYAGEILVRNGAEIARIQDTISYILRSFGVQDFDVYVLSSAIFLNINVPGERAYSVMRYVVQETVHLRRVDAVNRLSREIAAADGPLDPDAVMEKLRECAALPVVNRWLQVAAVAASSGAFCYLLGGDIMDSLAAIVVGFVLQCAQALYRRRSFVVTILNGALATLVSILTVQVGLGHSLNHITIGAIISLVPGVALTTSMRDFFSSDYLSGSIHLIDALLTAICIAVGVGAVLQGWSFLQGGVLG